MTESSFDRKLFSKIVHLTESSYDRKLFPKNGHLTECFFFEKRSFDRKKIWLKVKQPWYIIRIEEAFLRFLNLHPTLDPTRIEFDCPGVFVAARCDLSVKWPFFEKSFRSNELSAKRPCAQFFFGKMIFFVERRLGQMTIFWKKKIGHMTFR
jgi:hypothetical protein